MTSGNSWILNSSSAHHEARPHLQQPALGSLHPTAGPMGRRREERGAAGTAPGPLSNNNAARRHISLPVPLPARTPTNNRHPETPGPGARARAHTHRSACALPEGRAHADARSRPIKKAAGERRGTRHLTSLPRRPGNYFPGCCPLPPEAVIAAEGSVVSRSFGIRKDTEEQPRHTRSAIFTKPRGRWGKPRCGQSAFLKCPPLHASVLQKLQLPEAVVACLVTHLRLTSSSRANYVLKLEKGRGLQGAGPRPWFCWRARSQRGLFSVGRRWIVTLSRFVHV